MATKKWFVVDGENEMGPLGPNGLRRLIKRGEVIPGTMVRREDHEYPIRADHVRGLFHEEPSEQPKAKIHGPFTSLRAPGWFNFAAMCVWVGLGILGLFTGFAQRAKAIEVSQDIMQPGLDPAQRLLECGMPFLGVGSVAVGILFIATGVMFSYWLWCARLNLPHLIQARMRFAPNWTVACWFVPILNLMRPYQVIEEIDRLSAEAAADGDASVRAESLLLVPWWVCTILMVALSIGYKLMPVATAEQIADATPLHIAAAAAVSLAAGFGAVVFLRITTLQERAHDSHPEPVTLHHALRSKNRGTATG